ncbi:MAG: ribonuclease D [Gammaproteobacteria bacterium]|nr:ribonuclease D [Gammaproteobacteria bacterium]NIR98881.1 ribonuclease D [Gammaproteobacteria bacterium]NIT64002.1 ribonuclease D [Gammaproteobacteria bacterium]NIV19162.1 ribonuclease D [Gammaproteobacteria bacterium]NIX10331.1 ribonuclease D [Gammaproteobacteria bacterium]
MTEPITYIDTAEDLAALARHLAGAPWLCVDTEFIRDRTYFPQLCLLQVAGPDTVACIDTLAVGDLDPLLEVLYAPESTKVLHAAHQDLEILFHLRGEVPAPVFDTQIAAALLGYSDQIGYANLVEQMLDVRLDKAHTRADWSARPLPEAQLRYAADDVIHLRDVYQAQRRALHRLGRLDWLEQDFTALSDPVRYRVEPERCWLRVKDARGLKGRQLAVLQALAAWREERARRLDRPRRWVLRDDLLVELARAQPESREALRRIRGLDETAIKRLGGELLGAIEGGRAAPREQWPEPEPRPRLTPHQDALVDAMMALVRVCAADAGLSPTLLASRRTLERLAAGDRRAEVLHGWRATVVGERLRALLHGEACLTVDAGRLVPRPI